MRNYRRELTMVAFGVVLLSLGAGLATLPRPASVASAGIYKLTSSTYVGGLREDSERGIDTDAGGNTYITGGTASPTFPITEGPAYQTNSAHCDSLGSFGTMDVFVTKLAPSA